MSNVYSLTDDREVVCAIGETSSSFVLKFSRLARCNLVIWVRCVVYAFWTDTSVFSLLAMIHTLFVWDDEVVADSFKLTPAAWQNPGL